ncbi:MAG TPA: AAA family ATPase [Candidatus Paceibacterota bacterium]|nr:AAA family ATPase [Candidatus Paceibacterota bacterium]
MTQREALAILTTGANVFLTGEPGSGKTHTVNAYVRWLHERGVEPAITASTGIAATHIGGMTIHAWSGIGVLTRMTPYDLDRIQNIERVAKRIRAAHILIIDEISMLSANTLDMVDQVCRAIRNPDRPFGGLQVVFVGDFFQLPPISRESHRASFAFDAAAWKHANPLVCYLSEQHRQEDSTFLALLSAIRAEAVTEQHRSLLATRQVDDEVVVDDDAAAPVTRLYTHNASVDRMNDTALAAIEGRSERFVMTSRGAPHLIENLKRGCLSPETLVLKEGARVMFTKNDPMNRYANGTLGTVVGFSAVNKYPIVELLDGDEVVAEPVEWKVDDAGKTLATITQVPLRLAWAITVHKSQGMSLDSAVVDLSAAFEYGQGYVALSRVRSLEGLSFYGMNDRALMVHPEIAKKDREFRDASAGAEAAFDALGGEERENMERNFMRVIGAVEDRALVARMRAQKAAPKVPTVDATLALLKEGKTLADMAEERDVKPETIIDHLEQLRESGRITRNEVLYLADEARHLDDIQAMFRKKKSKSLKTIFAAMRGEASYADIRLARLLLPG